MRGVKEQPATPAPPVDLLAAFEELRRFEACPDGLTHREALARALVRLNDKTKPWRLRRD